MWGAKLVDGTYICYTLPPRSSNRKCICFYLATLEAWKGQHMEQGICSPILVRLKLRHFTIIQILFNTPASANTLVSSWSFLLSPSLLPGNPSCGKTSIEDILHYTHTHTKHPMFTHTGTLDVCQTYCCMTLRRFTEWRKVMATLFYCKFERPSVSMLLS